MISLCLIAAHMVGDFVFQTQWMASNKFTNKKALLIHCLLYTACFVPVAIWFRLQWISVPLFLLSLFTFHVWADRQPLVTNHPWPWKQFYVDQTFHICVLVLLAFCFLKT